MLLNIWLLIKLPYNLIRIVCHYVEHGAQSIDMLADAELKRQEKRALRAKEEQTNQPKE